MVKKIQFDKQTSILTDFQPADGKGLFLGGEPVWGTLGSWVVKGHDERGKQESNERGGWVDGLSCLAGR